MEPVAPHIETVELYGGVVRLEFNQKTHRYTIWDGETKILAPSVTTVCGTLDKSGPLLGWAVNSALNVVRGAIQPDTPYPEVVLDEVWKRAAGAHRTLKAEAADIGTQAHQAIEAYLAGSHDNASDVELAPLDERVTSCVSAAKDWLNSHDVSPISVERRIYSRKHRYSGTMDLLAKVDGRLAVVDWKSSKGFYPEFFFQTAAYAGAVEEETGERIERRWLVRLGKDDGAFEPHELRNRRELKDDYRAFLGLLRAHRRLQNIRNN